MSSIKLDAQVGPDGAPRLAVPVGSANQDVEVAVAIRPRSREMSAP
jgi:hypothetical protein